jgi:hypothetical protein
MQFARTIRCLFWCAMLVGSHLGSTLAGAADIFVSRNGADSNIGAADKPIATLVRAQELARSESSKGRAVTIHLRAGRYNLSSTLMFTPQDSGTEAAPVIYQGEEGEVAIIASGMPLTDLNWTPYKSGIMRTPVPPDFTTDQLFINDNPQTMARYPKFNLAVANYNGDGKLDDVLSAARIARWSDPAGGFIHALHEAQWGGFSYRILGKNPDGTLRYEGGWQNNRPSGMNKDHVMVENIFEELDSPGEWYLNNKTHTLYFYPPAGPDLSKARVEGVRLPTLVAFGGTSRTPVRFVSFKNVIFTQTSRTFMETKEPLLRTDWAIYRGGAILFRGAESCSIVDCTFRQLGGNAIFVDGYNRKLTISGCHLHDMGGNGVAFIGSVSSVRNPLLNYAQRQHFQDIDQTPGPQSPDYPAECLVDDCLIHNTGIWDKQSAPIAIDIADSITVRHCSIYHCPRAGINIGDGCFGGHTIDGCDVFDTVRETGDHGCFNSWGRDRWWQLQGVDLNKDIASKYPDLPRLDCVKPITLTNSRWRCDRGWDIDLDDGSTAYIITNNLCLRGGIKNREGFYRRVENNIMVNAPFCPHVWFADSSDVFSHNILTGYAPAGMSNEFNWGAEMDYNLFTRGGQDVPRPAAEPQRQSGRDEHSIYADPKFVDPARGDFRVKDESPALQLGFKNFPMDRFGVQKPSLKVIAQSPVLPPWDGIQPEIRTRDQTPHDWRGITVRNVKDENEMSVYGTPGVTGVVVSKIDSSSRIAKSGLQVNDVILGVNGTDNVRSASDLKLIDLPAARSTLHVLRDQVELDLEF